jgi:transcriptional regulator with XRE-family HTH domain
MDTRKEIREFLTSRRARITPEEAGLRVYGARRVPGLRREEVAMLAGLSVDYYNRLERGNLGGASDGVLDALSDALRLDSAERAYLINLARASHAMSPRRRRRDTATLRPGIQWMLDSIVTAAAVAQNGRLDALGANHLGRALYPAVFGDHRQPGNWARFVFLDPGAQSFYPDWDRAAGECVAILRSEAARRPHDRELSNLIGELATRSHPFRELWAAHKVQLLTTATRQINHPIVGPLELHFERLEVTADPELLIVVLLAEPRSRSAEALALLASWAATHDVTPKADEPDAREPGPPEPQHNRIPPQ